MKKSSALYNARLLAYVLKEHQCMDLVVAPGSRNAPLIIAANALDFETYSVPDERAAAFTALGMALESGKPAAVICTSGSAAANFLPAVTEAYFQEVPLVVITADRPAEWIGQGAGQTIKQEGLFGQHILFEANLQREPHDELAKVHNQRLLNEALIASQKGPVHINIPFDEPLYQQIEAPEKEFRSISFWGGRQVLRGQEESDLARDFFEAKRVLLLAGQMPPSAKLADLLNKLQAKRPLVLMAETLSNIPQAKAIHSIDRFVNTLSSEQAAAFQPDLVISFGGEVVSKMIKAHLRKVDNLEHWSVHPEGTLKDSFLKATRIIQANDIDFFEALLRSDHKAPSDSETWVNTCYQWEEKRRVEHQNFLAQAPYSDFKVFAELLGNLPKPSILHCANSASIRYAQLFDQDPQVAHYANRGTSGIDGSTSTAIGHALKTNLPLTLISGDVAFLYDSAAFWNDRLPQNLKVIVLNNQGGNIFRIIKGPDQIQDFERFQETSQHQPNLKGVADTFGIRHQLITTPEELSSGIKDFLALEGLAILEIRTPRMESPEVLKHYFSHLKAHGDL